LVELNSGETSRVRSQSLPTTKVGDWECQTSNDCCEADDCATASVTASTTSRPDFSDSETYDSLSTTDCSTLHLCSAQYVAMPVLVMMPVALHSATMYRSASPLSQKTCSTAAKMSACESHEHAALDRCVRQGARHRRRNRGELKLAVCLEQLQNCDPRCVLRVAGMGRRADPEIVKRYFETRYGVAETLLLANSLESRSIMGFLVMRHAEQVACALADGSAHEVAPGASVRVRNFFPRETTQS